MCVIAPHMNRNKKTAVMGMSGTVDGRPPIAQVVGGYGPDLGIGGPLCAIVSLRQPVARENNIPALL